MSLLLALLTGEDLPSAPPAGVGRIVRGAGSHDDESDETWTCPTCSGDFGAEGYYWSRQASGKLRRHSSCKACHRARAAKNKGGRAGD